MPGIDNVRSKDPHRLNRPGVVHWFRRQFCRIFCHPYQERWLSTFFVDHLLLALVGSLYCILQPMLADVHITMRHKHIDLLGGLREDAYMLTAGVVGMYSGVLMVGFLCVTLGNGVRPRAGYAVVFQFATLCLAVSMALEFLVQQEARMRYSQFQLQDGIGYYKLLRFCMGASQLFATHGVCMLCAMHLGHAQHFQKCPDMPWSVASKQAFLAVFGMVTIAWLVQRNRSGHNWPICQPQEFMLVAAWECFLPAVDLVMGVVFLTVGLRHYTEAIELGSDADWMLLPAVMKFIDFDSFVILATFIASTGHQIAVTFEYYTERMLISWAMEVCSNVSSLGLAVFTFACWKKPPMQGWTRFLLWLALMISFENFMYYQSVEDCEMASALPGCCTFPSFPDVSAEGKELWQMCALDHRCMQANPVSSTDNRTHYCKLPHLFHHGGHEEPHKEHRDSDLKWGRRPSLPPDVTCTELKQRWRDFPTELKVEETREHEESFSTAFRQFKALGSAGNIEFNFALMGVLMKVIFLVYHPNSIQILEMRRHSQHGESASAH